tara:strand:- start:169 stop:579 length:411 start_codon:yes stop_codon:yes gene_type:complete
MIDTDKYEGHTEGGWYVDDAPDVIHPTVIHANGVCDDHIITELVMANGEEWTEEDYANARLIADAPLILQALIDKQEQYTRFTLYAEAEIKRLRDAIVDIADEIEAAERGYTSTFSGSDDVQLRKMFEDLKKVILQ